MIAQNENYEIFFDREKEYWVVKNKNQKFFRCPTSFLFEDGEKALTFYDLLNDSIIKTETQN